MKFLRPSGPRLRLTPGVVTDLSLSGADPELRLNPAVLNKTEYRVVDTAMVGANADWKIFPTLNMTADIHESTSKRNSGGNDTYVVLRMNQPQVTRIRLTGARRAGRDDRARRWPRPAERPGPGTVQRQRPQYHFCSRTGDNIDDNIRVATVNAEWKLDRFHVERLRLGLSQTGWRNLIRLEPRMPVALPARNLRNDSYAG